MEEVEVANRAAVESCHRVLALLSQQQDPALLRSIASETGEACANFRKVVALLGDSGSGHARARFSRRGRPLGFFNQKGFSGSASLETMPSSSAAPSPSTSYAAQLRARVNGASEPRGLDLAGSSGAHHFGTPKLVQPLSVQFQIGIHSPSSTNCHGRSCRPRCSTGAAAGSASSLIVALAPAVPPGRCRRRGRSCRPLVWMGVWLAWKESGRSIWSVPRRLAIRWMRQSGGAWGRGRMGEASVLPLAGATAQREGNYEIRGRLKCQPLATR